MPVLEQGELVPDHWEHAGDEDHLSAGQHFIVCLDRLRRDEETLLGQDSPLGVVLRPGNSAHDIAAYLPRLALVIVEFPSFRDGRGFTIARSLRERFSYEGDIRATGHLLPDQHALLLRAGFSSVELSADADLAVWQAALKRYDVVYQPGAGEAGMEKRRLG